MPDKKTITGKIQKSEDSYSINASTDAKDREKERLLASSFAKSLPAYLKDNPVILFAHDYWKPPIAKSTGGRITENALILDIEFAKTEMGQEIKYLYDNGFMNTFSVGFIPKEWDVDNEGQRVYTEVELLEVSAVPVPMNQAATMIRQAKAAGINMQEFEKLYSAEPESKSVPKGKKTETKLKKNYSYVDLAENYIKRG